VLNTVGAFLVVSLASPVYDLARLRNTQAAEPGSRLQWNSRCPSDCTSHAHLSMSPQHREHQHMLQWNSR
jgi:hypothetical protein